MALLYIYSNSYAKKEWDEGYMYMLTCSLVPMLGTDEKFETSFKFTYSCKTVLYTRPLFSRLSNFSEVSLIELFSSLKQISFFVNSIFLASLQLLRSRL